ncbi:MAG: hypothetical protein JWR51_148 [Devosia sp.]|nr:hypothetical protein [Devosia sp.]
MESVHHLNEGAGLFHRVSVGLQRGALRLIGAALFVASAVLLAPTYSIAQEAPAAAVPAPLSVSGFRSAQFGMDEAAVRAAIKTDFALGEDAIVVGSNTVERTKVLTIKAPDVLPEGGISEVSYVFGYASSKLIQVGISWSPQIDPAVDAQRLYANGDVLVAYFAAAGYVPETVRSGIVLNDGILLFRGEDSEKHATVLLLQGSYDKVGDSQPVLTPLSLALLYAEDSTNPDIFQLKPGQF